MPPTTPVPSVPTPGNGSTNVEREISSALPLQARTVPQSPQVADWKGALSWAQNRHADMLERQANVKTRPATSDVVKQAQDSAVSSLEEEAGHYKALIDFLKRSIETSNREASELSQIQYLAAGGNGRS